MVLQLIDLATMSLRTINIGLIFSKYLLVAGYLIFDFIQMIVYPSYTGQLTNVLWATYFEVILG